MNREQQAAAAWQMAPGQALTIRPVDRPVPTGHQILVRNSAIAINPLDILLQDAALLPWLDYPVILGSDIAGEVVAVGPQARRFAAGDRVLAQAVGTTVNQPGEGGFQTYTLVEEHMAAQIPNTMAFTDAVVLPLGIGTAACGLFQTQHLNLALPSLSPRLTGTVVLVWGGASSVGCNAIQLAAASGHSCITVASRDHAAWLIGLGASQVVDYRRPSVVADVVQALAGKVLAGTIHATGNMDDCFDVVSQSQGRRTIATTLAPIATGSRNIDARQIFGTSLREDEVGTAIYNDFLPHALAVGAYHTAPPARIAGQGLEALQAALNLQRRGVSGEKIVVGLA